MTEYSINLKDYTQSKYKIITKVHDIDNPWIILSKDLISWLKDNSIKYKTSGSDVLMDGKPMKLIFENEQSLAMFKLKWL